MEGLIYLDHAATTPMRPEAVAALMPFLSERFGNAGGNYRLGRDARRAVDDARDRIAAVIGCEPGEIIFTSGGTESDNTVIAGAAADGRVPLCGATEHHAVLDAVARDGGRVVAVDRLGRLDLDALAAALAGEPAVGVVSVMTVNNEIGTINDIAAVAATVRAGSDAVIHTDAVQVPGWLDLAELWPHVDALSLSAHKFGGPKGVGVLVARRGTALAPLLVGGGQERGRRSGTHNVGGIVAAAVALELTAAGTAEQVGRVGALRDRLVAGLVDADLGATETVPAAHKIAGNAHMLVADVETESLLYLLDEAGVCASAASACSSGALEPSHVLLAVGVPAELAAGAIRFTLGSSTQAGDVDRAVEVISGAITRLHERRRRRAAPARIES